MSDVFGSMLIGDTMGEILLSLQKNTQVAIAERKSAVECHNAYTIYVAVTMLVFMAGRPVRDFFGSISNSEIQSGLVLVNDKARRPRTSLRLCSAPNLIQELLGNYKQHLLGLACSFKRENKGLVNLRETILALHQGDRSVGTPFFFLIGKQGRTKTIRKKHIERAFSKKGKIRANIGRHFFASTALVEDLNQSITAGRLGHYMTPDHWLGRESSLSILEAMNMQSRFVEDQIRSFRLAALDGIPVYDSSWTIGRMPQYDPKISLHRSRKGSDARLRRKKKRKAKERKFVADFVRYLRALSSGKTFVEESYEAHVVANLGKNGYPSSRSWEGLHEFLESHERAALIMPSVEGIRKPIQLEKNPITPTMVTEYVALKDTREQWIRHLNDLSSISLTDRVVMIVIHAALFDNVCDKRVLKMLSLSVLSHTYLTQEVLHVELYDEIEGEYQWASRLEAHGLTALMLLGLHREVAKLKRKGLDIRLEKFDRKLIDVLLEIGVKSHGDAFLALERLSKIQLRYELPGYVAAKSPEWMFTGLLPETAFVRLLTGKVLTDAAFEAQVAQGTRAEQREKPRVSSPLEKELHAGLKALSSFLNKTREVTGSQKRINKQAANEVQTLWAQFPNGPQVMHIIYDWVVFLLQYGTEQRATPSVSTPLRYLTVITQHVASKIGLREIDEISEDEFERIYLEILSEGLKDRKTRFTAIRQFHTFLCEAYSVEPCDLFATYRHTENPFAYSNGNIISDTEYHRVLEFIRRDKSLSPRRSNQYQCFMILMYQFGLRFGEAQQIQLRDVSISQASRSINLHLRKRKSSRLKTSSASREINCSENITDREREILVELSGDLPLTEATCSRSLFTKSQLDHELIPMSDARLYLAQVLKAITRDTSVVLHTLRHSFITRNIASLIQRTTGSEANYWQSAYCLAMEHLTTNPQLINPLGCLTLMVGHGGLSTMAESYMHCKQQYKRAGDDILRARQLKKKSIAILLNESVANLRKRGADIESVVQQSIATAPLHSLADDRFEEFDMASCIERHHKQKDDSVSASIIETVFHQISSTPNSADLSFKSFDLSEQRLIDLLRISEEVEHETKFYFFELFKTQEHSEMPTNFKSVFTSSKERASLIDTLNHFEVQQLPKWGDQHFKIFNNGVEAWKRLIDGKTFDLVADREYLLTPIFSLADQLGFRMNCSGHQRGKGKSVAREQSLEYSFKVMPMSNETAPIKKEKTFHKVMFILVCWFEINKPSWRKL